MRDRESEKGEGRCEEREERREEKLSEERRENGVKGGKTRRERTGRRVGNGKKGEMRKGKKKDR